MSTYNGWANYETWNIALWLSNDESLYRVATRYNNYTSLRDYIMGYESQTPDKVRYDDNRLDLDSLDSLVKDIT